LTILDYEHEPRIPRPNVPLPTQPPYTAHIGNLAFELTEKEIEDYFEGCKVISVRIMKDRMDNRPKGFGYVEFEDLESLKRALALADGQLAGRTIRISVAEPRMLPRLIRKADRRSKTRLTFHGGILSRRVAKWQSSPALGTSQ